MTHTLTPQNVRVILNYAYHQLRLNRRERYTFNCYPNVVPIKIKLKRNSQGIQLETWKYSINKDKLVKAHVIRLADSHMQPITYKYQTPKFNSYGINPTELENAILDIRYRLSALDLAYTTKENVL